MTVVVQRRRGDSPGEEAAARDPCTADDLGETGCAPGSPGKTRRMETTFHPESIASSLKQISCEAQPCGRISGGRQTIGGHCADLGTLEINGPSDLSV